MITPRLDRNKVRRAKALAMRPSTRHQVQNLLDTNERQLENIRVLIDSGVNTPELLQSLANVEHNIASLKKALGEIAA